MPKRFADTGIWNKDWFLDLPDKKKLLVKFLFDNCDCAGVYEISRRVLRNSFEENVTKEDFKGIKQVRFISEDKIFLEDFIKFQYNVDIPFLNPLNKVHKGVIARLKKHNLETLLKPFPKGTGVRVRDEVGEDNTTSKQIDTSSKLYGEYLNVCLTKEQHGKLLAMCASEKLLNELINSFSVNIEVGKERPYIAELPNAHFERLKSYYNYRKKNPDKFATKSKQDIWEEMAKEYEEKTL